MNMNKKKQDFTKRGLGLIKWIWRRKISRNLLNQIVNEPTKEEVESIRKPTQPPRTGKWESVKPRSVLQKSVNEDLILS